MARHGATKEDRIIGNNLRKFRLLNSLTQTELAGELNLTFQQVQKYEKGSNRIGGGRILQICRYLKITPAQLLGDGGEDATRALRDEISILGTDHIGIELARAFNQIESGRTRRLLADLALQLAGQSREPAKLQRPIVKPAHTAARAGADT